MTARGRWPVAAATGFAQSSLARPPNLARYPRWTGLDSTAARTTRANPRPRPRPHPSSPAIANFAIRGDSTEGGRSATSANACARPAWQRGARTTRRVGIRFTVYVHPAKSNFYEGVQACAIHLHGGPVRRARARPTGPHAVPTSAPACPPLVGLRLLGLRLLSLLSLLGLLLMCFVLLVHGRSRPLFTARWNYTDAFGTSVATYVWLPLFVHPTNPRLVRVLWRDEWRLDDASMYPFAE